MKALLVNKIRFVVVEGPDGAGKSTLIDSLAGIIGLQQIEFPKTLPSGALLRINTEKDFELLFATFEHLDRRFTYLIDRFMLSNIVYDSILRNEDVSLSEKYRKIFADRFDVLEIVLTRDHIGMAFEDDRIKMPAAAFNDIVDYYEKLAVSHKIVSRNRANEVVSVNLEVFDALVEEVKQFAR